MRWTFLLIVALTLIGCGHPTSTQPQATAGDTATPPPHIPAPSTAENHPHYTPTEQKLLKLVSAFHNNSDIHKAFVLPQLAQKIAAAQKELHSLRPDLSLLILDAVRPLSVQRTMFHQVQGTPLNIYVSNPRNGPGLHNYGAAVDITLADTAGNWLPMGSAFDHFGPEAHIDRETELLTSGLITQEEFDNRRLLRRLMRNQGLIAFRLEWWHFNLMSRTRAQQTLKPIDL